MRPYICGARAKWGGEGRNACHVKRRSGPSTRGGNLRVGDPPCHFRTLFPHLAHRFPPILELVPATGAPLFPPSAQAASAARAFVRIIPNAPLVRDRLEGVATVLKDTQHVLASIVNEAEARRVVALISSMYKSFITPIAAIPPLWACSLQTQQPRCQTDPLRPASSVDSFSLSTK